MNRLTKLLSTILALTLLVAFPVGAAFAVEYPLIAGQVTEVGTLSVSNDGTNLTVEFNIDGFLTPDDNYNLLKTAVYASTKAPTKGAVATGSPGQFPFQHFPLDNPKSDTFVIPLSDIKADPGDKIYVAAHANVENLNNIVDYDETMTIGYTDINGDPQAEPGYDTVCPTLDEIAEALPVSTLIQIFNDGSGYYDVKIDINGNGAFATDGTESFDWYCIDHTHSIGLGLYTVRVYSSYETLPDAIVNNNTSDNNVDHPENLDLVNWVINNSDSLSQVQQQDVIWALVDDDPAKGPGTLDAAELIVYNEALSHDGFVPVDGEKLAIVLQPVDASLNSVGQVTIGQVTIGQVTLALFGLECDEVPYTPVYQPIYKGDTSWAIVEGGTPFPRSQNWGSYFNYSVAE